MCRPLVMSLSIFLALFNAGCVNTASSVANEAIAQGFMEISKESPSIVQRFWHQTAMISVDGDGYMGGTGIVFLTSGSSLLILTNHHVSREGCKEVGAACNGLKVRFGQFWNGHVKEFQNDPVWKNETSTFSKIKLVFKSPESDIAVLRVSAENLDLRSFKSISVVRDLDKIDQNDEVWAIGFPIQSLRDENAKNVRQLWSTGRVKGIAFDTQVGEAKGDFLVHTADLLPGMSGGGLFNKRGELIGIQQSVRRRDPTTDSFSRENIQFTLGSTLKKLPSSFK